MAQKRSIHDRVVRHAQRRAAVDKSLADEEEVRAQVAAETSEVGQEAGETGDVQLDEDDQHDEVCVGCVLCVRGGSVLDALVEVVSSISSSHLQISLLLPQPFLCTAS